MRRAGSRGAVLFQRFWDLYSGAVRTPFATPWQEANPATTPQGIADRAAAVTHLAAAARAVREQYGSERVPWGDVNRFRAGSLDLPGDGATGTYGTFRVMTFAAPPVAAGQPARAASRLRVAGHVPGSDTPVGFGDGWVLVVDFSRPGRPGPFSPTARRPDLTRRTAAISLSCSPITGCGVPGIRKPTSRRTCRGSTAA